MQRWWSSNNSIYTKGEVTIRSYLSCRYLQWITDDKFIGRHCTWLIIHLPVQKASVFTTFCYSCNTIDQDWVGLCDVHSHGHNIIVLLLHGFVDHYFSLAEFEIMCMFKALHKDSAHNAQPYQGISREEFYRFYEVQGMRWKHVSHTSYMQAVQCVWYTTSKPIESINIKSIYIDMSWNSLPVLTPLPPKVMHIKVY